MRAIQEGDMVIISESLDIYKYPGLWWNPLAANCLGRSGRVMLVGESFSRDTVVWVKFQDYPVPRLSQTFCWLLEDVSLHPLHKWRRQSSLQEIEK